MTPLLPVYWKNIVLFRQLSHFVSILLQSGPFPVWSKVGIGLYHQHGINGRSGGENLELTVISKCNRGCNLKNDKITLWTWYLVLVSGTQPLTMAGPSFETVSWIQSFTGIHWTFDKNFYLSHIDFENNNLHHSWNKFKMYA